MCIYGIIPQQIISFPMLQSVNSSGRIDDPYQGSSKYFSHKLIVMPALNNFPNLCSGNTKTIVKVKKGNFLSESVVVIVENAFVGASQD